MPDQPTPPTDPAARIAELEAEVARLKVAQELIAAERDLFKEIARTPRPTEDPYTTPTPEEVHELMHGPKSSVSLRDVIAEFDRQHDGVES